MRYLSLFLIYVLLCTSTACRPQQEQTNLIEYFTVSSKYVGEGEELTIRWKTQAAKQVWLNDTSVNSEAELKRQMRSDGMFTLRVVDSKGRTAQAEQYVKVVKTQLNTGDFPLLFVTQVPPEHDNNTRFSAFANHLTTPAHVPRGGDLIIRYPNGNVRNLTHEAGYGNEGVQGDKSIAVREPSVHWSGEKAIFSMLLGSPKQGQAIDQQRWQLYEVTGLGKTQKAEIKPVPNQDKRFNNLSPIYDADDNIIFTSDRPRNGATHLYPQLDEYEATPSTSGIWKLDPKNGKLQILSHTPSGAFQPLIDRFGRVIFTRWDHLQQDQLADRDRDANRNGVQLPFRSFNYSSEDGNARDLGHRDEQFPESRVGSQSRYGYVNPYRNNFFGVWQIDQDGGNEETINHLGLHEVSFGAMLASFNDDPALGRKNQTSFHTNQLSIKREGGLFQIRENPLQAGEYFAVKARESASFATDSIVKFRAAPSDNPERIAILAVTPIASNDSLKEGRMRNPLPLSNGQLIASHSSDQLPPEAGQRLKNLRLRLLRVDQGDGLYHPDKFLSPGFHKKLSWWNGKEIVQFKGELWETEAVEVRPRPRVHSIRSTLELPEKQIFEEEKVKEDELISWLTENKLALIITRDQTSRDRADLQQPFNLKVTGGKQTISMTQASAKVYDISHFQIVQAEQVRAYADRPGRRHLAQPIQDFSSINISSDQVKSSVIIAKDGSTAAFVPAERALSWQTTDAQGTPIVRERNWVSFKAGEIRTCAACHGINTKNQADMAPPINKPEALRELLQKWKKSFKTSQK
ncbi:hypothetical protein H8K35_02935 [Undibacterium sp. LX40W]|uniref:Hydrazine synthase alpha subunit middle domain-containing protein n=1 Tax=Undibacterium nitidum TaxID=2762298 RepID=A0A923HT33_9BURK|nr:MULTISPECIES: hypothetical protein [Undibacterium]MBC3880659.1 hypothetical protein [Undibacterium nitidum]MBC3890605.1 hypothetical protein [Undibacterium sp. LX40W]